MIKTDYKYLAVRKFRISSRVKRALNNVVVAGMVIFISFSVYAKIHDSGDEISAVVINLDTPDPKYISSLGVDLSPVGRVNVNYENNADKTSPKFFSDRLPKKVYTYYTRELNCLAVNIYFEARGQEIIGQMAVGAVTLNRVISDKYPNSICKVVWQKERHYKTKKITAQFSWTLDEYSNKPKKKSKAYKEAKMIAKLLLSRDAGIADFTKGSMHYHADYVNPTWAKKLTYLAKYDDHIFYTELK